MNKEALMNMVNAIAAGDKETADTHFNDVMKEKSYKTLDQYKESVAFSIDADVQEAE